jgi:hypothetical protein
VGAIHARYSSGKTRLRAVHPEGRDRRRQWKRTSAATNGRASAAPSTQMQDKGGTSIGDRSTLADVRDLLK